MKSCFDHQIENSMLDNIYRNVEYDIFFFTRNFRYRKHVDCLDCARNQFIIKG